MGSPCASRRSTAEPSSPADVAALGIKTVEQSPEAAKRFYADAFAWEFTDYTSLVAHPGNSSYLIIDGGNSHFPDTARREKFLNEQDFEFLGIGVSGGEEGARHGASIMAGGRSEVYERVRPILEAASAKVDGEPCAAHVGNGAAGHYVKMVHNGIEYGLMQLIAEAYDLLKRGYHMPNNEMAELFAEWNRGELNSFLIEITSQILRKEDSKTGEPVV